MKLILLTLETSKEPWLQVVTEAYTKKISRFIPFEVQRFKSPSGAREQAAQKVQKDSQILLEKIKPADFVVLCDEKGQQVDSLQLSKKLIQTVELAKPRILVIIGGAYGVSPELQKRANWTRSLSQLTLNHFIARAVVMEQLYRACTIWKGIPYHNE